MRRRRFATALCVPAAAFALTACGDDNGGGGDEPQTTDEFVAEVEEYCIERSQVTVEALTEIGGPRAPLDTEQQIEQTQVTVPITEETVAGFDQFEAPEEVADQWEEFVSLRQDAIELGPDALEAAENDDLKAYQRALDQSAELRDESNAVGEEIGFTACAGKLTPEDEEAVTAVIEEVETEATPEQCTELFRENYLENNFGKVAGDKSDDPLTACEEFQEGLGPDDLAKSIDVQSISGPEPNATVEETAVGGPFDGQATTWRLVKEDGAWKVSDIAQIAE